MPAPHDDLIRHLYLTEGLSTHRIASQVGLTPPTVWRRLKRMEVPLRSRRPRNIITDPAALTERYRSGASIEALAEEHGVAPSTIIKTLEGAGVKRRPRGRPPGTSTVLMAHPEAIADCEAGMPPAALAAKYGVHRSTAWRWVRRINGQVLPQTGEESPCPTHLHQCHPESARSVETPAEDPVLGDGHP